MHNFLLSRLFRLRQKRPLNKLMILGNGGCNSNSPGLGNVAIVKDLMTATVVTHNFRCSKFGIAHSAGSGIGWVCYINFHISSFAI